MAGIYMRPFYKLELLHGLRNISPQVRRKLRWGENVLQKGDLRITEEHGNTKSH